MARTGRPREFDRDKALDAAMMLFWEHGYEPSSLSQIQECMGGISTASFYAAFGSKEALFREAVERYQATHGTATAPLRDMTLPPRKAIELALRRSARMQTAATHPRGCLIVLGANNCSPDNEHIEELLTAERDRGRRGIAIHIARAVASGELPPDTDTATLTTMFNTFLLGISLEARDGVKRKNMDAAITELMRIWDAVGGKPS